MRLCFDLMCFDKLPLSLNREEHCRETDGCGYDNEDWRTSLSHAEVDRRRRRQRPPVCPALPRQRQPLIPNSSPLLRGHVNVVLLALTRDCRNYPHHCRRRRQRRLRRRRRFRLTRLALSPIPGHGLFLLISSLLSARPSGDVLECVRRTKPLMRNDLRWAWGPWPGAWGPLAHLRTFVIISQEKSVYVINFPEGNVY